MSFVGWIARKWLKHRIKKVVKRIRHEGVVMNIQNILAWLVNLKVVPSGWLTKSAGWLGILSALACMTGHPLPWLPCANDPATSLTAGLIGVGLGRRGTQ